MAALWWSTKPVRAKSVPVASAVAVAAVAAAATAVVAVVVAAVTAAAAVVAPAVVAVVAAPTAAVVAPVVVVVVAAPTAAVAAAAAVVVVVVVVATVAVVVAAAAATERTFTPAKRQGAFGRLFRTDVRFLARGWLGFWAGDSLPARGTVVPHSAQPYTSASHLRVMPRSQLRRGLRARPATRRSYSASGNSRSNLATTPICHGMTR